MKKAIILVLNLLMTATLLAQENVAIIEKGAILKLGKASALGYKHIDFPRKNTIIKRGAIADFNNLAYRKVVVKEVLSRNGDTKIVLERKDGLNFFRFFPTVEASLEKALAKGELILPNSNKEDSIAQR